MSTDGKFSNYVDDPMQDIFCSISCEITKQAAEFRSKVEDTICLEWGFKRDDLIARLNELERIKKENERLRDDNKRLSRDRDTAIEEMDEAYAKYHELRDRVETLAHRVEEMLEEMIGAVHGL